ncbi:uncharacterized protein IL334_006460 [Kwoniella shivajii]|uniref:Uncharacterized protein n=1 Tax=Kwoniella shivajii TaxID=564305 RepID=A0ABZ1D611_9TREE|nr:hypothetical protein IL334_006460 [Kwoniella shivajii]
MIVTYPLSRRIPISSSSYNSPTDSNNPLKIFLPIFFTFFGIVLLVIIIQVCRRASFHNSFRSAPPRQDIEQPYTRQTPFEVDPPTITPYPAPTSSPISSFAQNHGQSPIIQNVPVAYHTTPTIRDNEISVPTYNRTNSTYGQSMPPTYDDVIGGR